ncbi:MAG: PAS domain-containing protein [Desulfatiglans sp.]|nr:PAS domain-containing protein [Desulfatiglans sp.]
MVLPKKNCFDAETSPPELLKKIAYAFDQQDTMAGFTDLEGKVIFANQSALRNVGSTPEEVNGVLFAESAWRRHSQAAKTITKEMLSKAMDGERQILVDSMINSEGQEIPAIFSISPIYDSAGKLVGLLPEGKDISDLKALQEKLEKERWQTQQWLDSLDTNVAMCDLEGRIITCNLPYLNSIKSALEDVKGKKIYELSQFLLADRDQNRIRNCVLKVSQGQKCTLEASVALPGKADLPFIINISPISDIDGNISYLAVEAKDISEQVRLRELMLKNEKEYSNRLRKDVENATQALRKTEEFSKNIVDSAPMGIIHLDLQGKVVFANPEIEKKLASAGFKKGQIKGKCLSDLSLFPADGSWERIRGVTFAHGVQFKQKRVIMQRKGKKPLLFEASAAPLKDRADRLRGIIVIMTDVTERARLEAELFRTRMQSEKLASLGQLIAGVAHEINNPLTSVIGCSEYLLEDCDLKEKASEAAEIIANEARRSGRIVKNLLAFARQSSPEKRLININELISSVLDIRMYGLKDRGITVALHLDEEIPLITVDANQIQQVILNLLNNAVDAISDSGIGDRVSIRTFLSDDNLVVIIVEDNGPGIPEKIRGKIIDPFFTTKETGKGTGLGLSISYGIIRQHGGNIEFSPLSPSGVRFYVTLPLSVSKDKETSPAISAHNIPSRVLVVDDEKNVCLSVSNYLRDIGSQVDTALSAKEALEKVSDCSYDLLLVDLKMPEMDGLDLYKRLAEEHKELARRFILMTGFQSKSVENYRSETGNLVLAKPFDRKEIIRTLVWFANRLRVPDSLRGTE